MLRSVLFAAVSVFLSLPLWAAVDYTECNTFAEFAIDSDNRLELTESSYAWIGSQYHRGKINPSTSPEVRSGKLPLFDFFMNEDPLKNGQHLRVFADELGRPAVVQMESLDQSNNARYFNTYVFRILNVGGKDVCVPQRHAVFYPRKTQLVLVDTQACRNIESVIKMDPLLESCDHLRRREVEIDSSARAYGFRDTRVPRLEELNHNGKFYAKDFVIWTSEGARPAGQEEVDACLGIKTQNALVKALTQANAIGFAEPNEEYTKGASILEKANRMCTFVSPALSMLSSHPEIDMTFPQFSKQNIAW